MAGDGTEHRVLLVPQQYATIQAAIDDANGATTILVAPGFYPESLHIADRPYVVIQSTHLTRRGVTLAGSHAGPTGDPAAVLHVERSTLHLSGIEIRSNGQRRGLQALDSSISFQDCVIAGNRVDDAAGHTPFGAGVWARGSKLRVQKSSIIGNVIDAASATGAAGAGLHLESCQIEIAGCTIQANAVYAIGDARGGGIWCAAGTMRMWRSRVTDNVLHAANGQGGGVYFSGATRAQLGGSVITGNGGPQIQGGGLFVAGDPAAVNVHGNTVVRQNFPDDVLYAPSN